MIKMRNIFQNTSERVTTKIRLRYNTVTGTMGFYTEFYKYADRIYFKVTGKCVKTNLPALSSGYVRHHIAYHFDDPDKGVVVIKRNLHMKIHNPHKWNNSSFE